MKKNVLIVVLGLATMVGTPGCSNTRGSRGTTSTITNSIIAILAGILQQVGNTAAADNLKPQTRLDAIVQGAATVSTFKNLLVTAFQVPLSQVEGAYPGFTTIRSVADFIMQVTEISR